ncbi:hypothetical protein E2C01_101889 [Portunus trituberculatus]|uniref:Uncharacterized protein n=1 Tax=Portunus trituberculatus TaxID=210409 RepID=A0A5B7K6R6_PORTR|nr:hypothetical protein [Portunus trituberculatus]
MGTRLYSSPCPLKRVLMKFPNASEYEARLRQR